MGGGGQPRIQKKLNKNSNDNELENMKDTINASSSSIFSTFYVLNVYIRVREALFSWPCILSICN